MTSHFIISGLITSITTLFLAVFVFFANPTKRTNQYFSLYTLSISIWAFAVFKHLPGLSGTEAVFWGKMLHFGAIFIPILFIYFSFELIGALKKEKIAIIVGTIFAIAFQVINIFSPLLISGTSYRGTYCFPTPGPLYPVFFAYFVLCVIYGLVRLVQEYNNSRGEKRTQLIYLIVGSVFGYLGGLDNFMITVDLIIFPFFPFGAYAIAIYTLITAYAITKAELMDIRVVITRSAAYGFVGLLMILSFLGINLTPISNFSLFLFTSNAALAIFWALAAHRLREFIQTPLEEKWITDWYDSEKLVNSIAQKLVPVLERDAVFQTIADELNAKIKIKNIEILPPGSQYDGLDVAPVEKGVVIPLSSGGGPEGTLLIGPKISEDAYNDKDITLFKTIQAMALSIFDRIRPYEKIKKDFEANEKKLYDTERTLARSEKIASLANLIREYNHEIKTPLSIIRGETALLPKQPRDQSYLDNFRDLVFEQVDRANDIVESTLRLSLPKERKEVELNINEIIEGALRLFPLSGVHLEKMLASVPNIKGDRADLELVFVNLFKNAVEAMPDGGQITVKSHQQQEGEESFVYIEVSDTGAGIPAENLERIFEPFFSTHVTKGRGLGLSIVFRIVREHLGHVDVKSQLGKGTTFILKFPVK